MRKKKQRQLIRRNRQRSSWAEAQRMVGCGAWSLMGLLKKKKKKWSLVGTAS
jgi:hypothetical protein